MLLVVSKVDQVVCPIFCYLHSEAKHDLECISPHEQGVHQFSQQQKNCRRAPDTRKSKSSNSSWHEFSLERQIVPKEKAVKSLDWWQEATLCKSISKRKGTKEAPFDYLNKPWMLPANITRIGVSPSGVIVLTGMISKAPSAIEALSSYLQTWKFQDLEAIIIT